MIFTHESLPFFVTCVMLIAFFTKKIHVKSRNIEWLTLLICFIVSKRNTMTSLHIIRCANPYIQNHKMCHFIHAQDAGNKKINTTMSRLKTENPWFLYVYDCIFTIIRTQKNNL